MKIAQNFTDLIGNTPLIRLNGLSARTGANILGKCEFMNPSHSVKDRISVSMIQDAVERNLITANTVVIEPTSGNTGIGLASVCASLGIKLIITMPDSMSEERIAILRALGARVELTEALFGMQGAIDRAKELAEELGDAFIPQQFENSANPQIHRKTTAQEILRDTDGEVDIFVAAVGTGGTLTGIGEVLKEHNPNITIVAVEPTDSAVLSGKPAGPHKIQGIGAGFVPKILNTDIYDIVMPVSYEDAVAKAREVARTEGILVGISAGANIHAAAVIAGKPENRGKTIVTILCDSGERYLSAGLFR